MFENKKSLRQEIAELPIDEATKTRILKKLAGSVYSCDQICNTRVNKALHENRALKDTVVDMAKKLCAAYEMINQQQDTIDELLAEKREE